MCQGWGWRVRGSVLGERSCWCDDLCGGTGEVAEEEAARWVREVRSLGEAAVLESVKVAAQLFIARLVFCGREHDLLIYKPVHVIKT
jgi:hypothetical protein